LSAHLAKDARLEAAVVSLGADFSRMTCEVQLAEEGAESEMLGLCFPSGAQTMEHWTLQDHQAPHTFSRLSYRGAADQKGRSLYYGRIHIHPGARGADAYQENRHLLLAEEAHVDTNPQLQIENNDVHCTHGSSVGPLNEAALFYLMSRGLPRAAAEEKLLWALLLKMKGREGLATA
jgi:Fe-S cluster assembly protein SufD